MVLAAFRVFPNSIPFQSSHQPPIHEHYFTISSNILPPPTFSQEIISHLRTKKEVRENLFFKKDFWINPEISTTSNVNICPQMTQIFLFLLFSPWILEMGHKKREVSFPSMF
ncbi:MAG: hypothetical protein Q4D62_10545 [Planctomycetia bacterium]|nr:hypothetical protein [Planctomycetia bacterium]